MIFIILDFDSPVFTYCQDGESLTVDCSLDNQPDDNCEVTVQDDIDSVASLWYNDTSTGSCGVNRLWSTQDSAGNIATFDQTIQYVTSTDIRILKQPVSTSISCGSLKSLTEVFKEMFKIEHPCGLPVAISYADDKIEQCATTLQRTWSITDDCGKSESVLQFLQIREAKEPLEPQDGQINTGLSIYLRWQDPADTMHTDLYFWEKTSSRPSIPIVTNHDGEYLVQNLEPGTQYFWQLVFHYSNNETYLSPIWAFETRRFVDLIVQDIETPLTAFTGQECTVRWTVVNVGTIDTQYTRWWDRVYLSWDDEFSNARTTRVAMVTQINILYPADGYSSEATFTLDERTTGNAYIFIHTNALKSTKEYNTTNNLVISEATIDVRLTPPPDLQVLSLVVLGNRFFSGKYLIYTVPRFFPLILQR